MEYLEIDSFEDAIKWLRSRRTVTTEQLHMLLKEFMSHQQELADVVKREGIEVTGGPTL